MRVHRFCEGLRFNIWSFVTCGVVKGEPADLAICMFPPREIERRADLDDAAIGGEAAKGRRGEGTGEAERDAARHVHGAGVGEQGGEMGDARRDVEDFGIGEASDRDVLVDGDGGVGTGEVDDGAVGVAAAVVRHRADVPMRRARPIARAADPVGDEGGGGDAGFEGLDECRISLSEGVALAGLRRGDGTSFRGAAHKRILSRSGLKCVT